MGNRGEIIPITCDANHDLNGTGCSMVTAAGQTLSFPTASSVTDDKAVHEILQINCCLLLQKLCTSIDTNIHVRKPTPSNEEWLKKKKNNCILTEIREVFIIFLRKEKWAGCCMPFVYPLLCSSVPLQLWDSAGVCLCSLSTEIEIFSCKPTMLFAFPSNWIL